MPKTLFVDLEPDETLVVSGPAVIQPVHKSGRQVRLRVVAEPDVRVDRCKVGAGTQRCGLHTGRKVSIQG